MNFCFICFYFDEEKLIYNLACNYYYYFFLRFCCCLFFSLSFIFIQYTHLWLYQRFIIFRFTLWICNMYESGKLFFYIAMSWTSTSYVVSHNENISFKSIYLYFVSNLLWCCVFIVMSLLIHAWWEKCSFRLSCAISIMIKVQRCLSYRSRVLFFLSFFYFPFLCWLT